MFMAQDLDIVIDVGAEYNPARHRYDHHQREFNEVFGHGFGCTKLSSAGEHWHLAAATVFTFEGFHAGYCMIICSQGSCTGILARRSSPT